MDEQRVDDFESVALSDVFLNHSFGAVLQSRKDSDGRAFREQCVKFMNRLVDAILAQQPVTGEFSCGLYAFCPELLLEGDDRHMLELFPKLVPVLESSGCVSAVESRTAVEEYSTFVVEARKRHASGGSSAEYISDIVQYLLSDYSFLSRKALCRVFKLCCLVVLKPRGDFPAVDISFANGQVPEWVVTTCICGVQSSVSSADFKLATFFTKFTMHEVWDSINAAQTFMPQVDFDPWTGICSGGQAAFVDRYTGLFNARVNRKHGGASQQVSTFDESSRGGRLDGNDGFSAAVLSDSSTSAVSAPLVSSSSVSSSFRRSKAPIHSSLASFWGERKMCQQVVARTRKRPRRSLRSLLPRVGLLHRRSAETVCCVSNF